MSTAGVHRGFLRKYGGFMFKQWKEKYLVLTMEGSLLVCRDAESPPDQVVALQSNCESIAEGREILDLPRLPPGGRRDCCFALILPQNKFLLLLSDNPDDCILWLKLIRKVREVSQLIRPFRDRQQAPRPRQPLRSNSVAPPHRVSDCLRHGNSSDAKAVRAVCLLMGGAAASSALGYLSSCSPSSPLASRAPDVAPGSGAFSDLPAGGSFHACSQDVDSPHFNTFDFEGDSDFDAFDCGGFAF
ncbi:uncharacterized protein si:ch1073-83n3.2 [Gambusia affinis]|uniref:uncharacterized protein si:ch1073-83n3.2 n=1 Tax=Gambusia affinis TaxID=33528 RepID=UPI001CDC43FE|nr:uncharacterized protein si:ch1073-83n3.2 [Gambusia affinis]